MSSSDSEHSTSGFQQGSVKSSEDSDSEYEKVEKRKNNKKACKKRKRMKKVVTDSDNSSETEGTKQLSRCPKRRKKRNSDQTPDHGEITKKANITSDAESEERSPGNGLTASISSGDETEKREPPVKGSRLTASISSGDETEKRELPVKGSRLTASISSGDETEKRESLVKRSRNLGSKAEESNTEDDSPVSQNKTIKNEKETQNGSIKQEIIEHEEDSLSHPGSPHSKCIPENKSGSKQKIVKKTVLHSSDSSDDTSDTDGKNKSAFQEKNSPSDGSSSSESSTVPGILKTTQKEELKSDRKEMENKAAKETGREEDSSSSSDQPLSKYSDGKQKLSKKNEAEHMSSDSSDSASGTDEKKRSLYPKKRSQSDESSSSESSSLPDVVDKKGKRKSDQKNVKNKKQKDPGNTEKINPKIERLKKYLRVAGLRVRSYQKLWEGCKTNKAKIEKLLQMLSDAGLKGKPTLQKCKRLQAKRERKEEVASLDIDNIIVTPEKGRPKRNALSLYSNRHTANAEEDSPKKKDANTFSRIKNIVDSESE